MTTIKLAGDPRCPRCAEQVNGVTSVSDDSLPDSGSFTICAYCAQPCVMERDQAGNWSMREPTPAELAEAEAQPDWNQAMFMVRVMIEADRQGVPIEDIISGKVKIGLIPPPHSPN